MSAVLKPGRTQTHREHNLAWQHKIHLAKTNPQHYILCSDGVLTMPKNPTQIADDLEIDHGLDEAMKIALNGAVEADRVGDKYTLSVMREVKGILRDRIEAANDDSND